MKKIFKRLLTLCLSIVMLTLSFLSPVTLATSGVYELTFDNLFIFEQWANHANLMVHSSDGSTNSTLTTDISSGSFVLTNNTASTEVFTTFSMSSVGTFYSMPVKENTEYVFSYEANGTTTNFETFVFYFNKEGNYTSHEAAYAYQYGLNEWSFTTPEGTEHIQVRFDNNSPQTDVTVSSIRIREKAVYDYAKDNVYRKTFTYSAGNTYGELPVIEREDLVFVGWFTGPDGTGQKITSDSLTLPSSRCLYSKWDPVVNEVLEIVSLPQKQNYSVGESLNTRGLVIGVTYPDGKKENIDEGFYCSPETLTQAGTQTILVTYGNGSAQFTVNVKSSETKTIYINDSQKTVNSANHTYTIGYSGSSFNQYKINYSSDAYVKGELNFNGTIETFFLEPAQNGEFSSYIDGFLDGKTQSNLTSISFTPLDKANMDFTLTSINLTKPAIPQSDNNGVIPLSDSNFKIGIDLKWGGALTYMEDLTNNVVAAKNNQNSSAPVEVGYYDDFTGTYKSGCDTLDIYEKKSNVNLINAHDTGRLVQQSYYGTGSYPYEPGMYGEAVWNYNPVQGGNLYNEPSKIVDLKVTTNEIYIKCRPLDWAKTKEYITPSYMEAWYTLENGLMRATCRFVDFSGYPSVTTTQELPAFYCVEPLNKFVYYEGGEAWSDSNKPVTKADLGFWGTATDQDFICNENWGAFVGNGAGGYGIGIYTPGQTIYHAGVYYGSDGQTRCSTTTPATEDPTSYMGIVDTIHFQSYSPISYCYYITTGNINEIRESFKTLSQAQEDFCNATHTNGFCDMCGKYIAPKLNEDNIYEISNAGELHWFSDYVNSGNVNANAVLLCDITDNNDVLTGYGALAYDTSTFRKWSPIGNATNKYNGHFDGQGYTINGLFTDASSVAYGGLFGYVGSSAVVEEVGVDYSFLKGGQYVGGIVGRNEGTINNCYALYTVVTGDSYVGGIAGYNNGTVKNCYNAGDVRATSYVGGIAGSNNATVSNCYYLLNSATDSNGVVENGIGSGKTIEEFASGEVACLLQGTNTKQLWGQKANIPGTAPVFDKEGVYKVTAVENEDNYVLADIGDIVKDDKVDIYDYQQLVNQALSDEVLDFKEMLSSDIDGDGSLDVIDCWLMQLLISGYNKKIDVYLKGDFDFDGTPYTKEDIAAIKKALINQDKLNTKQKYACDLNFDGVLDINDRDILVKQGENNKNPFITSMKEVIGLRSKTANVIILAGQSNAYGISPLTNEVKATIGDTDFSNIKIKYTNINSDDGVNNWRVHFSNSEFETFRLGIGGQADRWFGPELGVAYYLATNEATKDETWYIIKYTGSGTFLGGQWLYDTTGKYLNTTTSGDIKNDLGFYLADGMMDSVSADLEAIANKHGANNVNIRSFMWMQGESDASVKDLAEQYDELQNIFINRVRTELGGYDKEGSITFVNGAIAAYKSGVNIWPYADIVNSAKASNATYWYVPENTAGNVINKTTAGLYTNDGSSATKLTDSIWIDTSTCLSKLENNNENGENDGYHYCGEAMLKLGIWFAQGMLVF